jgi:hypothetical protein
MLFKSLRFYPNLLLVLEALRGRQIFAVNVKPKALTFFMEEVAGVFPFHEKVKRGKIITKLNLFNNQTHWTVQLIARPIQIERFKKLVNKISEQYNDVIVKD